MGAIGVDATDPADAPVMVQPIGSADAMDQMVGRHPNLAAIDDGPTLTETMCGPYSSARASCSLRGTFSGVSGACNWRA
jgi:hypothetical protein